MPAEGQPIDSRGGAPGNEPAYPRAGAPAHETDPIVSNTARIDNDSALSKAVGGSLLRLKEVRRRCQQQIATLGDKRKKGRQQSANQRSGRGSSYSPGRADE
jgi:hypothetical protein